MWVVQLTNQDRYGRSRWEKYFFKTEPAANYFARGQGEKYHAEIYQSEIRTQKSRGK